METLKSAGLILVAAAVTVGAFAFIYITLFRAKETNMPNAARGAGLFALAGVLKVFCVILAEKASPVFGAPAVDYALAGLAGLGAVVLMVGFGEGRK